MSNILKKAVIVYSGGGMACGPVGGSNVGELTVESNGKTIYIVGKRVMMKTDKRLLYRRFWRCSSLF